MPDGGEEQKGEKEPKGGMSSWVQDVECIKGMASTGIDEVITASSFALRISSDLVADTESKQTNKQTNKPGSKRHVDGKLVSLMET